MCEIVRHSWNEPRKQAEAKLPPLKGPDCLRRLAHKGLSMRYLETKAQRDLGMRHREARFIVQGPPETGPCPYCRRSSGHNLVRIDQFYALRCSFCGASGPMEKSECDAYAAHNAFSDRRTYR